MDNNFLARKLGLGTVQFGLEYGINNTKGKIHPSEVFSILDYAIKSGVNTLDTAFTYGDSEEVIGQYILQTNTHFNIISKLPTKIDTVIQEKLSLSLKKLHIRKLYGYLFHDFNSFIENPNLITELRKIKDKGIIQKLGFSLYYPTELDSLFKKGVQFDIIQIPFNIFDQRFVPYFPILKKKNIEIHIRSVFLQGLMFKNPKKLPLYFLPIRKYLEKLNDLAKERNVSISSLCLNFVLNHELIDKIIIGVDSLTDLKENIESLKDKEKIGNLMESLFNLNSNDEKIILPTNWRL